MRMDVPRKRGRPRKIKPAPQPCTTIAQYMPVEPEYVMVPKSKCGQNFVDCLEGLLPLHPKPLLAAPAVVKGPVAGALDPA